MNINLAGKVALITGSVSGIGFGIAKALATAGVNVVIHGYGSEDQIDNALLELRKRKIKAEYVHANLDNASEAQLLVRSAFRMFDAVDILVNNAGKTHHQLIEEIPDGSWESIINNNLSSSFYTTKTVLPYMQRQNWGRIINISSVYGLVGSPGRSALVAAKHGLIGLTKTTALENALKGITCNAICPGFVLTELNQQKVRQVANQYGINEEQARTRLTSGQMPSKKFSSVEDIGELVLFLSSVYADNITGASYPVDGGWTAQ